MKSFIILCGSLFFALGVSGFSLDQRLTDNTLNNIVGGHNGPCLPSIICSFNGDPSTCTVVNANDPNKGCTGSCSPTCHETVPNTACQWYSGECHNFSRMCGYELSHDCVWPCSCIGPGYIGGGGGCSGNGCSRAGS